MSTKVRYELAYNFIFEKQPPWKKKVIVDNDEGNRTDERVINDFIKQVRKLAESDEEIPIVKSNRKPSKKGEAPVSGVK